MKAKRQQYIVRLIVVFALMFTYLLPSQIVNAQDIPVSSQQPIEVTNDKTIVRLDALGASSTLFARADSSEQNVTVPVPQGYRVVGIQGRWQRTADVTSGNFSVEQADKVLATVSAPSVSSTPNAVTIPLANALSDNDSFAFGIRLRPGLEEGPCSSFAPDSGISIFDAALVLVGADEAPTSTADFFPRALRSLEIVVPTSPSPADVQSALSIAGVAVREAHADPSNIVVVESSSIRQPSDLKPSDLEPSDLERRVVIDPSSSKVVVDGKTLRLPNAEVLANYVPLSTKSLYSFDDLGIGTVQFDGSGRLDRTVNISQADLGGPITSWTLRLSGNYTPAAGDATARFSVLVGGSLVRSVALGKGGHIDETVELSPSLMSRDLALTLRFESASHEPACTDIGRFSATILPESSLQVGRGSATSSVGFTRWPQVALPKLHVAFDEIGIDSINAALATLATLQAATLVPLSFEVLPTLEQSSLKTPLLAVVTKGAIPAFLNPPLSGPGVKFTDEAGRELITIPADQKLSSLQAYQNGGGNVLLLSASSAQLGRAFAHQLTAQPNGWFDLNGDVWFSTADSNGDYMPQSAQVRGGPLRTEPLTPSVSSFFERHRSLVVAGMIIIALILLAALYPKLVSDRPGVSGKEDKEDAGDAGSKEGVGSKGDAGDKEVGGEKS